MVEHTLKISWAREPGKAGGDQNSFVWNSEKICAANPVLVEQWKIPCRALFKEENLATILAAAFALKLSRSRPWDLSNVSDKRAFALASRVFKRGVPLVDPSLDFKNGKGQCDVFFVSHLDDLTKESSDCVLIDKNVSKAWSSQLKWKNSVEVDISEASKTLETAAYISSLIPASFKRVTIVGGGVLGDVAGFVAGLRDIEARYIPTTLLSMADSSIGGKTGVNADIYGKNQIGLFAWPKEVIIWSGWLSTLPVRECRSGMIECLKHAVLKGDRQLWNALINVARRKQWDKINAYLPAIVRFKADVVGRDPFESGERAILNLGHTLGHALETLSQKVDPLYQSLVHGEAVALGLLFAFSLSETHFGFQDAKALSEDLRSAGLVPNVSHALRQHFKNLMPLLTTDKKNIKNDIRWVLLRSFGNVARASDGSWTVPLSLHQETFLDSCKRLF